MKKAKPKKPRPVVLRDPPSPWSLGRVAHITLTNGAPVPRFLQQMIVKSTQGGKS